jgi:hypothetical protein
MAEMLLINPRRRKARRNPAKRSAAQRAATRRLVAMNRSRSNPSRRRARRRNPAPAVVAMNPRRRRMSRRRSNPVRMISRRRNPAMLGGFNFRTVVSAMQDALIQGGGAVAMDLLHGQINRFLPEMLKRTPGQVGLGDVVKASITVLVGTALRGPTRGLSMKAATGSLTVQAYDIVKNLLPSTMQLGYMTPGVITQGQSNVGPNRGMVGRYTQPGATPLLNRYTQPGATALLNGNPARMREGVTIR